MFRVMDEAVTIFNYFVIYVIAGLMAAKDVYSKYLIG